MATKHFLFWLMGMVAFVAVPPALAEQPFETVLDGLQWPAGVAVQPETGLVFVADRGTGKIVRHKEGMAGEVVVASSAGALGQGAGASSVPSALAFFDKSTLVVGDADFPRSGTYLRIFSLSEGGTPLKYDEPKEKLGPLAVAGGQRQAGSLHGLAISKTAIYASFANENSQEMIARGVINGTKFAPLEPFVAPQEGAAATTAAGLAIDPKLGHLVLGHLEVGHQGENGNPSASRLTFYQAQNAKRLLSLPTGLMEVSGLAYSPKGYLYALGQTGPPTSDQGLFRLDALREGDKQTIKAVKIAALARPAALAFGGDGSLFVTVLGTAAEAGAPPSGKLVKFAPGL